MAAVLPNLLVIGAMKCGTTALHRQLGLHPDVWMAPIKETNFFIGAERRPHDDTGRWWRTGQWHRGVEWYASLFDDAFPVRGETSPGYTSPDHPEAAERIAVLLPRARLVYLVRDPVARAVSQYNHHLSDGTEQRPMEEAILDPGSQYIARSRYHERLQPFLSRFPREQLLVVVQERLLHGPRTQLRQVFAHAGAAPDFWDDGLDQMWHVGAEAPEPPRRLRMALHERVVDDLERLQELMDDDIAEWGILRSAGGI